MGVSPICILLHPPSRRPGERRATQATSHNLQVDLPDAASDVDFESDVGVPIGAVHVRVALPLEPLGVDLAEATLGPRPHTHFARQQHGCLTDPALYAGLDILAV